MSEPNSPAGRFAVSRPNCRHRAREFDKGVSQKVTAFRRPQPNEDRNRNQHASQATFINRRGNRFATSGESRHHRASLEFFAPVDSKFAPSTSGSFCLGCFVRLFGFFKNSRRVPQLFLIAGGFPGVRAYAGGCSAENPNFGRPSLSKVRVFFSSSFSSSSARLGRCVKNEVSR